MSRSDFHNMNDVKILHTIDMRLEGGFQLQLNFYNTVSTCPYNMYPQGEVRDTKRQR